LFEQFKELKNAKSNINDQIAEQMAVDLMGEKGHEFVNKIIERAKSTAPQSLSEKK